MQRTVLLVLSLSLLISPDTRAGRATATAVAPVDGGWPRAYTTSSGARLVLYEPQVASWTDQKLIVMHAAASYTGKDGQTPALGTLRIEALTEISLDDRLVSFRDFTIAASNFPTLSRERLPAVVEEISSSMPREERVIGLDRVLAAVDTSEVQPRNVDGVKADPPVVFASTTAAVLVNLDGEPIWSPIRDDDLRFAVNTNWDLLEDLGSSRYYLRIGAVWMKAARVDGPWTPAGKLPDSFSRLPNDDNWRDARAASGAQTGTAPAVFVSRTPAELILLRGAPVYAVVPGTSLLWISNTESDVFRAGKSGAVYYLVSGRWFSAPDLNGPWTFATPDLPDDFRKIPLGHPRSRVLASVPGTPQALEAVLLAQARQTARVSRTQVAAPDVVYQGEPQFEEIEKTRIERAVNTDRDILRLGPIWQPQYYMCIDGVWFLSMSPTGPWTLADVIPKEIYEVPISSPAYPVTRVTVERADDEAVVYATDASYAGMLVAWGCAVWGTGWYHPPYVGWHGHTPVYYTRYPSYGHSARYNPWSGSYARAGAAYGPHGGTGSGARYNPRAGTYSRAMAAQTRPGANVYARWAPTLHVANRTSGATSGDIFAGNDGNVYRNQGGSWQRYENGGWRGGLSADSLSQLNRDFAARRDAGQRTTELGLIASRSGNPAPGAWGIASYRPSGGGLQAPLPSSR